MNRSKRHHYVPVFLTKHFCKENGNIIVYDKLEDKVFETNPINIFVKSERNTFLNDDEKQDDVIEKIYSHFDSLFAPVVNDVKENNNFTTENIRMLIFLAYLSKWRVLNYDQSFSAAKDYFSVDDLGLGIKIGEHKLELNLEDNFNTELKQEIKRFLLAIQPFRFKEDYKIIFKQCIYIKTLNHGIKGDFPLNEAQINSSDIFEDFAFPITKEITLIHSKRVDKYKLKSFLEGGDPDRVNEFLKDFSISKDLSTMSLSGRFSGCANKEYLNRIINGYKDGIANSNAKDCLSSAIFNVLYRYEDYIIGQY